MQHSHVLGSDSLISLRLPRVKVKKEMSVQDDCSVELWVTSMWFQSSSVGDPSHTDSSCTVAHYSFIDFNLPVNSALEPAHVIYMAVKWQVHGAAGHLQGERNLGTADGNRSVRLQFSR